MQVQPPYQAAESHSNANLLIVDDEPTNIKLLEKMLQLDGFRLITSVQDPRKVASLCNESKFDLILLDLNMPHMDGFEVMADLQQRFGPANLPPILVLTAQHDQTYRLRALRCGARDYLTKPFDRDELMARVRNLIEVHYYQKNIRQQNAILEDKVRERTQEIYNTRLQIVQRLGRAAEYRDNETGLHIIRMSEMSALLGRAAGMDTTHTEILLNASPMHDIGKIGIPDHILLKPGKFEPVEWEVMKTHTTIGADILSGDDSDILLMAREIALTHHEKWDGSGYPYGLSQEAIPLVGRIVALADVFDALTSTRPYKKAWTTEASVEYIQANSGKHFDPDLVKTFMEILPAITAIKTRYAEPDH